MLGVLLHAHSSPRQVHEVVRFGRKEHPPGAKSRTQYLAIPEVPRTHAVILSRPTWLWGAEMGANEHGLCAGNEAVFSREAAVCDDGVKRLLGMDLVRLVRPLPACHKKKEKRGTSVPGAHQLPAGWSFVKIRFTQCINYMANKVNSPT